MDTVQEFYEEAAALITVFNSFAQRYDLPPYAIADHIGYKCDSSETFEHLRRLLETESTFIYQSFISERRIAIVKLTTPFTATLGDVTFLELSDQKPDGSQKKGFDHVEMYPSTGTVEELVERIKKQGGEGTASIKPHHVTHNYSVEGFVIKIEPCALIQKISHEEMK